MVVLCRDCAESLLLSEKIEELMSKPAEEPGETIDLIVECMECGKEITAKLVISSSADLPPTRRLKRA